MFNINIFTTKYSKWKLLLKLQELLKYFPINTTVKFICVTHTSTYFVVINRLLMQWLHVLSFVRMLPSPLISTMGY